MLSKNNIIATLLPIIFLGCSNYGTEYTVSVSPQFSNDQIDEMVSASQGWLDRVNDTNELQFNFVVEKCDIANSDIDHHICVVPENRINVEINCKEEPNDPTRGAVGCTYRSGINDNSNILIAIADIKLDQLNQVFAHELGHAMGLSHSGKGTVMCKDVNCASLAPNCQDAKQYTDLRGMALACK